MAVTYLFASGKGGVGKTTLAASLGLQLARSGSSVVLVDADIGLRGLDALLNLENQVMYDLVDVIRKDCALSQALLPMDSCPHLHLLPAAQFAQARDVSAKALRKLLRNLRRDYDYILIDCPDGVERGFRNVAGTRVCRPLIVVTPDDLCLRDAERVLQLLREHPDDPEPRLLVNRLRNDLVRSGEMYSAETISQTLDCPLLGEIPEDEAVYRAQLRHQPLLDFDCEARNAIARIAQRLKGRQVPLPAIGQRRMTLRERFLHRRLREVKKA